MLLNERSCFPGYTLLKNMVWCQNPESDPVENNTIYSTIPLNRRLTRATETGGESIVVYSTTAADSGPGCIYSSCLRSTVLELISLFL
jgi:hypothetical protein